MRGFPGPLRVLRARPPLILVPGHGPARVAKAEAVGNALVAGAQRFAQDRNAG